MMWLSGGSKEGCSGSQGGDLCLFRTPQWVVPLEAGVQLVRTPQLMVPDKADGWRQQAEQWVTVVGGTMGDKEGTKVATRALEEDGTAEWFNSCKVVLEHERAYVTGTRSVGES